LVVVRLLVWWFVWVVVLCVVGWGVVLGGWGWGWGWGLGGGGGGGGRVRIRI